ncbi:MAG: hypothetical protein JXO44_13365 [Clostridia bacterium]|nr:hypothetical protein [Clostridia bacterium]
MRVILGIEINNREEDALKVQSLLTEYGCCIKMRLGMHDPGGCATSGLIILEFFPDFGKMINELEAKLKALESVKVGRMEF